MDTPTFMELISNGVEHFQFASERWTRSCIKLDVVPDDCEEYVGSGKLYLKVVLACLL